MRNKDGLSWKCDIDKHVNTNNVMDRTVIEILCKELIELVYFKVNF